MTSFLQLADLMLSAEPAHSDEPTVAAKSAGACWLQRFCCPHQERRVPNTFRERMVLLCPLAHLRPSSFLELARLAQSNWLLISVFLYLENCSFHSKSLWETKYQSMPKSPCEPCPRQFHPL